MAPSQPLLDRWGTPVQRQSLAAPKPTVPVRSPLTGYPADGMTPMRLAQILRAADVGDPLRYFELAEQIEERDLHYLGVLGTRKRSVSQIEVTVTAASDSARDVEIADMVRDWIERDELAGDLFNVLDCLGKGVSFTRIDWDVSEGQWRPGELEWCDPRDFRWDRKTLRRPLMIDASGREAPLEPFRYIYANIAAKSGLPLRSGLARIAAWGWMFKSFTLRDWAIFCQTYGQPIRLGRYPTTATDDEKNTLYRAVANIAGDCAAIVPEGMNIEFIESKTIGQSADLFLNRADWLDRQISKAVLGQTATTDAIAGGHAVGQEHREVQEDIETADARALSGILNRDLIRPWVQLEYGPQPKYPRLRIARPSTEDLKQMTDSLRALIPLGLRVSESEVRDRLGFGDPKPGDIVLTAASAAAFAGNPPPNAPSFPTGGETPPLNGQRRVFEGGETPPGMVVAPQAQSASAANSGEVGPVASMTARMAVEAQPSVDRMIAQIEAMMQAAGSLDEFREMLRAGFPTLNADDLSQIMATGLIAAQLAGRAAVAGEGGDA